MSADMSRGTPNIKRFQNIRAAALVLVASLCLGACSPGEVQLEGKLFELAGLNNTGKRGPSAKLAERSGLVVPPDLKRLPDPNQPAEPNQAEAVLATIDDPDIAKVKNKEELQRQQAEICEKEYEPAEARGDPDAHSISGPLGPCRKSVLTGLGNWMGGQ
ncbi:MAG: hypothetical protein K0U74_12865 [Alphaproteobacteria bacterium]|nr:hypothetical protein [Alphaproteobacteria bacterium]